MRPLAATRRTPVLVVVALLLLGLAWAVAPKAALPLYDGVGFPDDPYRFVAPPKGAPRTKPPAGAQASAPVRNGRAGGITLATDETGPQISISIPAGRLLVGGSAAKVAVTAAPVRPLPVPPGQHLWSNVYDVTASPDARLSRGGLQATITMRAATAQRPLPHLAVYVHGTWQPLPTFVDGRDIYVAELVRLGRFAVIGSVPLDVTKLPGYGQQAGSAGGGGSVIGIVVGVGALAVVVGLFLLGRWRRRRAAAGTDAEPLGGRDPP